MEKRQASASVAAELEKRRRKENGEQEKKQNNKERGAKKKGKETESKGREGGIDKNRERRTSAGVWGRKRDESDG